MYSQLISYWTYLKGTAPVWLLSALMQIGKTTFTGGPSTLDKKHYPKICSSGISGTSF